MSSITRLFSSFLVVIVLILSVITSWKSHPCGVDFLGVIASQFRVNKRLTTRAWGDSLPKFRYVNHPLSTSNGVDTWCYRTQNQCDNHVIHLKNPCYCTQKKFQCDNIKWSLTSKGEGWSLRNCVSRGFGGRPRIREKCACVPDC